MGWTLIAAIAESVDVEAVCCSTVNVLLAHPQTSTSSGNAVAAKHRLMSPARRTTHDVAPRGYLPQFVKFRKTGLWTAVVACALAFAVKPGAVIASSTQYCAQIPIVGGIPPWGFHTGSPISGATGSFARGHGDIDLSANTVSGILCQVDRVRHQPDRLIVMTVEHHLVYHSHYATMWGVPGNIMKIVVRVRSSTDPQCEVGTVGHVTLFASYNGVRSDSVQFRFPAAACADHDHLYHGTQVNNQVPPL